MPAVDPTSSKTTGYHIFLQPKGTIARDLFTTILSLAEKLSGPEFVPHVTLLARIPVKDEEVLIAQTQRLASECSSFLLTLGEAASEKSYYKALYLKIVQREFLTLLHIRASELFDMPINKDYVPHLSLLYGNYEQKDVDLATTTLHSHQGKSFNVESLHLYSTDGETHQWKQIIEVPFVAYPKI